jgi:demethylmenaquinone methyltransferase/2-methoxy-6-polyprenyl-1,4-benzoquinol methylase
MDDTVGYYAERAAEYDRIYDLPPWQGDLRRLEEQTARLFRDRRVFETACGTGYWTRHIARSAAEVYAVDVNETTLAIARSRDYGRARVRFDRRDAYVACDGAPRFDGGYAGLWLSHVDLARMDAFLEAFHSYLVAGATVFMMDERDTEGRRRRVPTSRTDAAGNRYERRRLENGDQFEIIKNFYDEGFFRRRFGEYGFDLVCEELRYFWTLRYRVRG